MSAFWNYQSAAERAAAARQTSSKLKAQGHKLKPVRVKTSGRKISETFWGQSWCRHLENYSDYESRLPRGRSYLRQGAVIDLQISKGRIDAQVAGSSLYQITIDIVPLAEPRWKSICKACTGQIDTVMDLLSGNISGPVMSVVTDPSTGLFPSHREIRHHCSCPDSASLCKHQAAVLYGVAVRLDEEPSLLFTLRGVDHRDMVKALKTDAIAGKIDKEESLGEEKLASIFGVDVDLS